MRSKFDSPAEIIGGKVEVCGPLEWEPGEEEAVVSVTITQRSERIAGAASSPPDFEAGQAEWMLTVAPSGNRKFKRGPARAIGIVCAMRSDDVSVFHWSEDIVLETN